MSLTSGRCRHLVAVLGLVLSFGCVSAATTVADQATPLTQANAEPVVGATSILWCNNIGRNNCVWKSATPNGSPTNPPAHPKDDRCDVCPTTSATATGDSPGYPPSTLLSIPVCVNQNDGTASGEVTSSTGSLIDNMSFNHLSVADDIIPTTPVGGCASCGSAAGVPEGAKLMEVGLRRIHRFRDMTDHSSFGPGVFCDFDTNLHITTLDAGGYQAAVFDPQQFSRLLLTDSGSGLYKGASWNNIQGLRFYSSTGGGGSLVSDPSTAQSAVLTAFNGYTHTFDLFSLRGSYPSSAWTDGDIGSPGSWGTAGYSNSTFHLSAGGADIGGTSDSFGYIYQAMTGDFTMIARVASLTTYRGLSADGTDASAKAGLVAREGLDANTKTIAVAMTGGSGAVFLSRTTTGGTMGQDANTTGLSAPRWLKLQRAGNVFTGSQSSDGTTWTSVYSKTVTLNSILYLGFGVTSHNTNVLSNSDFDNVSLTGTATPSASWPTPTTAPHVNLNMAGRLVKVADRNGYGVSVSYVNSISSTTVAPDQKWQMSTATDAHGRSLTFAYNSSQVSGRWALSSVTPPNGNAVTYSYSGGLLSGVTFPDSTTSSFTYTANATSGCTVVAYDDSGCFRTHRRKSAYLTNSFSATVSNRDTYAVYDQASNLVRLIVNGNSEVTYLSLPNINYQKANIYEGAGKLKLVRILATSSSMIFVAYYPTWSLDSTGTVTGTYEQAGLTGGLDANFATATYANDDKYRQGTASSVTDDRGVNRTFTNDADGCPTQVTYADGTTENFTYNSFKQVTRYEDRIHRVTKYTYDTNGNLTKKEVGIKNVYNPSTMTWSDTNQSEYASWNWSYYASGNAQQFLLNTATDANGKVTTYNYTTTTGANHYLSTVVTPADSGAGTITAWTYVYDSYGRLSSTTDALSRQVTYTYDSRDRLTKTTYPDTSTEIIVYGTGADKNLVAKLKDRQGVLTEYTFDNSGRPTVRTIAAHTMAADGSSTTAVDPTQNAAQSWTSTTTYAYQTGTDLTTARTTNGNKIDYTYDFRRRLLTSTSHPNTATSLVTTNLYVNNFLRQVTDPYSRKAYFGYRASDARCVRTVQGLIPSDGITDYTVAATISRSATTSNPPYVVVSQEGNNGTPSDPSDDDLDPEGQIIRQTDGRGYITAREYDSRGRLTAIVEASGDTSAGRTEFVYDAQGNLTDRHSPRYSDSGDTNGYGYAYVHQLWTQRNLLLENKEAPGSPVAGAEDYTYYDDGRLNTTTDRRGKVWQTTWGACCGRIQGQVEPLVGLPDPPTSTNPALITRHNDYGDLTHEAVVNQYSTTTFPTLASPTNQTDVYDADTVTETTTAYDVRHRRTAQTKWLSPLGTVNANSPPIAGQGGISSSAGLTTTWRYDDDLTDTNGLSSSSDPDSVYPYLSGLNLGTGAAGSAIVEINPMGEHRWTIFDGVGRVVRVVDGNGHAMTTAYDAVVSGLVDTGVTDANGHTTDTRADAAGRIQVSLDADSPTQRQTSRAFDADGNLVSVSDPNSNGFTAMFDGRNRITRRTDTHTDSESWTYDKNGNVLTWTDQNAKVTTYTYDARDRRASIVDRVGGTTTFTYDPTCNLLTVKDADANVRSDTNPTTAYTYDARGTLATETFQRSGTTSDTRTWKFDAARRLRKRQDQASVWTKYTYDMTGRLTTRNYGDAWPTSTSWDDTFTYDAVSRLTSAVSGRYGNTVTRDYTTGGEHAGRLIGETLLLGGTTYSVSYGYDGANRLTSVTYPDGKVATRTYTPRDQLDTVTYDSVTVASRTYDVGTRLYQTALHNGLTETRTYRTDNLIATISVPTNVTSFTYSYLNTKRKSQESAYPSAETQNFNYDDEGRLTGWNRNTSSEDKNWTLSKVGDMTSIATTYPSVTSDARTYDIAHQVLTDNPGTSVSLGQDAKGNMTSDQNAQGFTWDDENRITGAQSSLSSPSYEYDALGRRAARIVDNNLTTFINAGVQTVSEYTGSAWQSADIGTVGVSGSSSYASGVATSAGAGADITGTADAFRYVYASLSGSGSITAKLLTQGNTNANAKAGVMIRESTAVGSAYAMMAVTPSSGTVFQYRTSTNGATTTSTGTGAAALWVRLTRSGNTLAGSTSTDGSTWTSVGSATVSMNSTLLIGLPVCSHTTSATSTCTFTAIQTTGNVYASVVPTIARSYVYGSYVDEPLAMIAGSSRYYYHSNHLYSLAALSDATGTVVERYRYDAYGNRTVLDGAGTTVRPVSNYVQQYGFTGRYHDEETGLVYFRARQYSPKMGRFANRDPLEYADGANLYGAYFIPNQVDPFGQTAKIWADPNTCTIYITLEIKIFISNAALDAKIDLNTLAKRIEKSVNDNWAGQHYGSCKVVMSCVVFPYPGKRTLVPPKVGEWHHDQTNVIDVNNLPPPVPGQSGGYRSNVNLNGDSNTGTWSNQAADWTFAHESGHLMGLPDDYTDQGNTSVPHPGHQGHIMGEFGGKVAQHEIDDIMTKHGIKCPDCCDKKSKSGGSSK